MYLLWLIKLMIKSWRFNPPVIQLSVADHVITRLMR